jgi:hypothetical protein
MENGRRIGLDFNLPHANHRGLLVQGTFGSTGLSSKDIMERTQRMHASCQINDWLKLDGRNAEWQPWGRRRHL